MTVETYLQSEEAVRDVAALLARGPHERGEVPTESPYAWWGFDNFAPWTLARVGFRENPESSAFGVGLPGAGAGGRRSPDHPGVPEGVMSIYRASMRAAARTMPGRRPSRYQINKAADIYERRMYLQAFEEARTAPWWPAWASCKTVSERIRKVLLEVMA